MYQASVAGALAFWRWISKIVGTGMRASARFSSRL
jgi:hypothetical protein